MTKKHSLFDFVVELLVRASQVGKWVMIIGEGRINIRQFGQLCL
jgi:hypothetical protein